MAKHADNRRSSAWLLLFALLVSAFGPTALPASSTSVTSVTPNTGFNGGGYSVELAGTDFAEASISAVSVFTSTIDISTSYSVLGPSTLSVTIPSITISDRVSETVSIRVQLADGSVIDTDFGFEPASAQSITPASGSAAGGQSVELSGQHFSLSDISGSPVVGVSLISTTQSFAASMSYVVSDSTIISATIPVISAASRSASVFDVVVAFEDGTESIVNFSFIRPTITSVNPEFGSVAGGSSITISGTGFFDGGASSGVTELRIGSEEITDFTVVSDTQILATLPLRSGLARTIGDKKFFLETAISASDNVYFSFVPVRDASKDHATSVGGTSGSNRKVILGDLASRTQGKAIVRSGSNPYFVDGIDSITGLPYRYRTNAPYTHNPNEIREKAAYEREGTEAATSNLSTGTITLTTGRETVGGRTNLNAIKLVQTSGCSHTNDRGDYYSFCSVFGPEFYTEPFYGTDTQALSFDWFAQGDQDDYEIYAYLVAVPDEVTIPTPSAGNHTLAAHGMGYRGAAASNFWQTSTANIPGEGLYRFRFVNGSYDGTGGKALGSTFYVGAVFSAGTRNAIQFGPISDQIGAGNATFTVNATSDSGGEVDVTVGSASTAYCSVTTSYTVPNTTVTVTKKSLTTDSTNCTLIASQEGTDGFATPASEVVSFRILSAPTSASPPSITNITPDNQKLTVTFTRPAFDGGSEITNYEYSTDNGSTWTAISPANTTSLQVVITGLTNGTTYPVRIRAVTFGAGSQSAAVNGTPNAVAAPAIAYSTITQSLTVNVFGSITNPTNTGGIISGYTVSSGVLPAGLSLNTTNGFIQGTPTVTGSTTVYIEAFNSGGTSSPTALTIKVIDVPPIITYPSSTLNLTRNALMDPATPTFSGGPLTDSATVITYTGTLPSGLSIDLSTGEITGTPTVLNVSGVTLQIRAYGIDGQLSGAYALTIKVLAITPSISYSASQMVYVGTVFSIPKAELDPTTDAPTSYTITPALPTGVSLNSSTGVISGTATFAVVNTTVSYVVSGTNSGGSGTASLTIYYAPATPGFKYVPTTVSGAAGVAVSATPTTTSANSIVNAGTLVFTIAPSLPSGLIINSSTGAITGVPIAGLTTTSYTVTATNLLGVSSTSTFVLVVSEYPPSLSAYVQATYSLRVGTAVSITAPTNTGGPANWSITPSLPGGLTINSTTGLISGTPSQVTSMISYVVTAENATGSSSASIAIEVLPRIETTVPIDQKPPTPLVPEIESIVPSSVTIEGGEVVTVRGRGLGIAEELSIGGEKVQLLSATSNQLQFVMPPMSTGVYDLDYLYSGGSRLTYLRAMTVTPKTVTSADSADNNNPVVSLPRNITLEQWQRPWRVKSVVWAFAPGRSELTPVLKSLIRKEIRTYAKFASHIECVGFTMGPTVLKIDAALSVARAKAVCDYIQQLRPRLVVELIVGQQDRIVADRIRRVEVAYFRPGPISSN